MREYEIMLIVPPDADDPVIGTVTNRITQVLEQRGGGRITNVDRWGRRRFAYPIDKQTEGFYLVMRFEAESTALRELERVLRLADEVVRFKVVVRPEKATAREAKAREAAGAETPSGTPRSTAEGTSSQAGVGQAPAGDRPGSAGGQEPGEPAEEAARASAPGAG